MSVQSIEPAAESAAAVQEAETQVYLAAGAFGTALRASPEFVRLRTAGAALGKDEKAQAGIEAFNAGRAELQFEIRLGTLDAAQQAHIERLQAEMIAFPTVAEYLAAQTEFEAICRETAALISSETDIDFAANCRSGGCCGG